MRIHTHTHTHTHTHAKLHNVVINYKAQKRKRKHKSKREKTQITTVAECFSLVVYNLRTKKNYIKNFKLFTIIVLLVAAMVLPCVHCGKSNEVIMLLH